MKAAEPEGAPAAEPGPARGEEVGAERRWRWIAALICVIGLLTLFHSMLDAPLDDGVPVNVARGTIHEPPSHPRGPLEETDHRFVIWLVSRNARTLLENPRGLFQAEPCYPADDVLALGEPGIYMGLLGIPAQLLFGDPIVTYNSVLLWVTIISFVAMYLLVVEWTGVRVAGIVAAILFAFHEMKIKDSIHFFAWDNSWTVLALYFATRLFTKARWWDAVGLAIAIGMQLSGSFYPLLTAVFVAIPVVVWLLLQHGLRQLRPLQWLFVVGCMLLVAHAVLSPYLAASESGVLEDRGYKVFLNLAWLRPGGPGFPGWVVLALGLASFVLPRRFIVAAGRGDPRLALVALSLILFSLSTGGNAVSRIEALQRGEPIPPALPNLYDALSAILPGMKEVRGPAAVFQGGQMAMVILAGFGAAGLLRRVGDRWKVAASLLLILFAYLETLRPPFLGLPPRIDYVSHAMRPPAAELEFFQGIEERGLDGPILELPFNPKNIAQSSRAVLLAAYHERRTAQCFNSFLPPEIDEVARLAEGLPSAQGIHRLAERGFTTIVVRTTGTPPTQSSLRSAFEAFAHSAEGAMLEVVGSNEEMIAYDIVGTVGASGHQPRSGAGLGSGGS